MNLITLHKKYFYVFTMLAVSIFVAFGLYFQIFSGKSISIVGGCDDSASPYMSHHYNDDREISFCKLGDGDYKTIATPYFRVDGRISFVYAGYPQNEDIYIGLQSKDGHLLKLNLPNAKEGWKFFTLRVPEEFKGHLIRVVAIDNAKGSFSWIGLGQVRKDGVFFSIKGLTTILILVVFFHLVFTVTLSAFLQRTKLEKSIILFVLSLGLLGFISFWLNYLSSILGDLLLLLLLFILTWFFVQQVRQHGYQYLLGANRVLFPVSAYTLMILIMGLYPYMSFDWIIAADRWLSLPIDNWLPKIFADQVWNGRVLTPMVGDWLSSDRPPLQTGMVLIFYPLFHHSDVFYQVFSSFLQALVFLPIFIVLKKTDSKLILWGGIALATSSLFVVHTLFVWPKLLSLSFLILGYYAIFLRGQCQDQEKMFYAVVAGVAFSFAMLSHGGAIFAIAAILGVYLFFQKDDGGLLKRTKMLMLSIVPMIMLYLPWMLYQKLIDPPGDRLIKWHLAGMIDLNNLSVFQALEQAYQSLSVDEFIHAKLQNILTIFSGSEAFLRDFLAGTSLVKMSFFDTFFSYWWFSPIFAVIVWGIFSVVNKKIEVSKELKLLVIVSFFTFLFWVLLMFEPGGTVIHQGTFFSWLMPFLFSLIIVWQSSRIVFLVLMALNVFIFVKDYVLWSIASAGYYLLVATVCCLFVYALLSLSRSRYMMNDVGLDKEGWFVEVKK